MSTRNPSHPGSIRPWTAEETEQALALWNGGLSAAQIGQRMRRSKNAVISRAHRAGFPARPSPIKGHVKEVWAAPNPRKREKPLKLPALPSLADTPLHKPGKKERAWGCKPSAEISAPQSVPTVFHPRKPKPCCWPLSDGYPWRFCEAPSLIGSPYCEEHASRAFVRKRDRREDCARMEAQAL